MPITEIVYILDPLVNQYKPSNLKEKHAGLITFLNLKGNNQSNAVH